MCCACAVQVGALPAAGFVNGLALGKSGMLAVAALGQVRLARLHALLACNQSPHTAHKCMCIWRAMHARVLDLTAFLILVLCLTVLLQEPRLGRWGRIGSARNGLLVHRWSLADEGMGSSDESGE